MNYFYNWLIKNGDKPPYLGLIKDKEDAKGELYYYTKDETLALIKRCGLKTPESIGVLENQINEYYEYFEESTFGRKINKRFELTSAEKRGSAATSVMIKGYISKSDMQNLLQFCETFTEKFVLLGLYEGIGSYGYKMTDIVFTRASGIDPKGKTIKLYSGKKFKFSDELIDIAMKSAAEDAVRDVLGRQYRNAQSGTIFRYKQMANESDDPDVKSALVSRLIQRFKKRTGFMNISSPTLLRSGLLNAIEERLDGAELTEESLQKCQDILARYNAENVSIRGLKDKYTNSKPF